ncbi:hypothetical protein, partial [Pseudomonas aeruginosa]
MCDTFARFFTPRCRESPHVAPFSPRSPRTLPGLGALPLCGGFVAPAP